MKRFFLIILPALLLLCGSGCAGTKSEAGPTTPRSAPQAGSYSQSSAEGETGGKLLIAYFSATGNTKAVAEHAAAALGADLYEIVPEQPYTAADLDYSNTGSRGAVEQNDPGSRPRISGGVEHMAQYQTVFLAYPIWFGQAPRIISTFLESYEFAGKTIVPICTSGSSGIGPSVEALRPLCGKQTVWRNGTRFAAGASREEIAIWANQIIYELELA